MSNQKHNGRGISGKGYYIALILCAAAIGISGYLYYRNTEQPQLDSPVADASGPDNVAVVSPDATVPQATEDTQQSTEAAKPAKTTMPVSGQTVAGYAMDCLSYNATTRDWRVHNGIDIAAEAGTPVLAAADGTVYTTYEDDTMGTTVVIHHQGGYVTVYSSLAAEVGVAPGDSVTAGQVIGSVGNTALLESAIGDHVHFSVSCNDEFVDPMEFLS